jgi:cell division protease FtsH
MKVSKEQRSEFFRRKDILEKAKAGLKSEFRGLDSIIDEVIDLIEPWYLFPGGQIRPTIVNLWGMTGVGKTSLIKRLFYYLELTDSLYKFDVGDYASQDNTKLSYSFSEKLKNREKQQIGLIFDEFQLGRTVDEHGSELEKSGLRAMWDLLDSGKISILQSSYYGTKIFQLTLKLEDCVESGGVESKNGSITKSKEYHDKYFKSTDDDDDKPKNKKASKNKKYSKASKSVEDVSEDLFVPEDFYWYIQTIWDTRFITDRELKEYLKSMDHTESIEFLNDTMKKAFKPQEFDYSTSCIFVIGNIDEAYRMANSFDPDSDADRFYRHSLNITLPQIKSALKSRFRAEQIARLGNSHIIYPAFSSKVYKELITLELDKSKDKVKNRFDLDLEFDNSVNTIIFKEGVFPTQGARSVFTTITSIVESYVGKIVKDILDNDKDVKSIRWRFSRGKHRVDFFDKNNSIVMNKAYVVKLKVESLRKSDKSELQASVAIHEAGHAVAAIYGAGAMPSEIVSRTANMSEGLEKDIIISLGGYVAEKMIFGKENLSVGTGGDFERASSIALEMAKVYGMVDTPMFFGHKSQQTNTYWSSNTVRVNQQDEAAEEIIRLAERKCETILSENKYLLLKIGEYLSVNSRMSQGKVESFVRDFGKDIEIKDRNSYHSFKQMIANGLAESESKEPIIIVNGKSNGSEKTALMESKKETK